MYLGIGAGDEVIIPAQSHVATAHAVEYTGAKPVFIDVEKNLVTLTLTKYKTNFQIEQKQLVLFILLDYQLICIQLWI